MVSGAQPYDLEAGVELSPGMAALLPDIAAQAIEEVGRWGIHPQPKAGVEDVDYTQVAESINR